MENISNIKQLEEDFKKQKQMILFVGAGINLSDGVKLSWEDILDYLFAVSMKHLILGKDITKAELEMIKYATGIKKNIWNDSNDEINKELLDNWFSLYTKMNADFPMTMKASLIKNILGSDYISYIQQFLYRNCNKYILKKAFHDNYSINSDKRNDSTKPFHTLYQLARIIILCPYIKAIVTYNYDNFLRYAIEILYSAPESFFSKEEQKLIIERELTVKDIAGVKDKKSMTESDRFIFHVHGYIQSPSENSVSKNRIVLSLDEYNESTRNVYSWQNATQLHFLSHYTCIFAGLSLTDETTQRMLYFAKECGNEEHLYYLGATKQWPSINKYSNAYKLLAEMKIQLHKEIGLVPIVSSEGYVHLYKEFGDMVSKIMTNK